MTIAIVGNGAIGNLLALRCHENQLHFKLITRNGLGLKIDCHRGDQSAPLVVIPEVASVTQPIDATILILPLKAYHIIPAVEQLAPRLQPDTTIVLLHNGMGTQHQVAKRVPRMSVVAATTSYAAFKPDKETLIVTGQGVTQAGWITKPSPEHKSHTKQVEDLLSTLLPPCSWQQEIDHVLWKKLAINAVINPLTAIHQIRNGELAQPEFGPIISLLCDEITLVMKAEGVATSADAVLDSVKSVIASSASNFSSMYQDIANQRPTEIDFINGFIQHKAKLKGIAVPENNKLVEHIHRLQKQI